MSRIDFKSGRTNQKLRTRRALLAAARELMNKGVEPTIEEVAEQALVSRATAYRYFPNAERLILEATLDATFEVETMDAFTGDDAADRAAQFQERFYEYVRANETQFRLLISSANKEWVESGDAGELRGGRRLPVIEKALAPVKDELDGAAYRKLVHALAGMMGIESLVMMRDICGLSHEEAKSTMNWAVKTLVRAVAER